MCWFFLLHRKLFVHWKYRHEVFVVIFCIRSVTFVEKFFYFYQAPIVRFYYNMVSLWKMRWKINIGHDLWFDSQIFFICFLGLFSYVILVDFIPAGFYFGDSPKFHHLSVSTAEVILHLCIWGIIVEELRQVRWSIQRNEIHQLFLRRFFLCIHIPNISKNSQTGSISVLLDCIWWLVQLVSLSMKFVLPFQSKN